MIQSSPLSDAIHHHLHLHMWWHHTADCPSSMSHVKPADFESRSLLAWMEGGRRARQLPRLPLICGVEPGTAASTMQSKSSERVTFIQEWLYRGGLPFSLSLHCSLWLLHWCSSLPTFWLLLKTVASLTHAGSPLCSEVIYGCNLWPLFLVFKYNGLPCIDKSEKQIVTHSRLGPGGRAAVNIGWQRHRARPSPSKHTQNWDPSSSLWISQAGSLQAPAASRGKSLAVHSKQPLEICISTFLHLLITNRECVFSKSICFFIREVLCLQSRLFSMMWSADQHWEPTKGKK